jgi:hypothetical protein
MFHLSSLKRPKDTSVCILGSTGFPEDTIMEPFFFDVMAGATFLGSSKKSGLVIRTNVHQMLFGIEVLMNMATYTISIDDFVVF